MSFNAARLSAKDLTPLKIGAIEASEWFVHTSGRLLDRIEVEATDRITATKSANAWLVASRTDARFDRNGDFSNHWRQIKREGAEEKQGAEHVYPGGAGYTKLTRLKSVPGGLFVEAHAVFFEPKGWFENRPILKSKIAIVAQDRVRSLRRELAKPKSRGGASGRTAAGGGD
jgi:hypothetical protein